MIILKQYFILPLTFFAIFTVLCLETGVNTANAKTLSGTQQQFIQSVQNSIIQVNQEVLAQRERLNKDYIGWQAKISLSDSETTWLKSLAEQHQMKAFSTDQNIDWQELRHRVDTVPVSLALAQAIDESGWGRSRFAMQGNNLFGRWCYQRGCGIVPLQRKAGSIHEVKKYASRLASVRDYVHNINSNSAYQNLRTIRAAMRGKQRSLDGLALANGLLRYSSRGQAYVADIKGIISRYHLQ